MTGEYEVQDLRDRDAAAPAQAGTTRAAPQRDAEQDQAEDVARRRRGRSRARRAGARRCWSAAAPVVPGVHADPGRAERDGVRAGDAGPEQAHERGKGQHQPGGAQPGARRRASSPSVITPGISVSIAIKVSQSTICSAPWCAATLAARAVLESVV